MTVDEVVTGALETNPGIDTVYWVACGGSLIDLYPAHQLVSEYGSKVVSGAYTAREFCLMEPARLTERAFVVACSHSGNTPEVVDACRLACERGAAVLAFTDNADSAIMQGDWTCWVYPWGDDVRAREVPSGISLLLASELLDRIEGFELCDDMFRALDIMDDILPAARERVRSKLCPRFARLCQEHEFLYILGSGAVFSQAYALAICSLMEMQWQHCSYIHSGEYFHGPFEVTEPGVFYLLQMGSGPTRAMDERALSFLETHTDTLMVVDALDFGMGTVLDGVRGYLDPILFYALSVELRAARGKVFDHDPSVRRYMGIEKY